MLPGNVLGSPSAAQAAAAAVAMVTLPSVLHAQVGDVFQLFYFDVARGSAAISCRCNIGSAYARYFEVTPSAGNIGDHTLTISAHAPDGSVLKQASTVLRVSAAPTNPSATKHIAILGDSLAAGGGWTNEFIRRLVGTGGTPAGNALTNYHFIGESLAGNIAGYGITGNGGWRYADYLGTNGSGVVVASTHDKTTEDVGSEWTCSGSTYRLLSVAFPAPYAEIIENGGLELWEDGHPTGFGFQNPGGLGVAEDETVSVNGGGHAVKMTRGAAPDPLWHSLALVKYIPVSAGKTYTVRAWCNGAGVYAAYWNGTGEGYVVDPVGFTGTGSYRKISYSFTAPEGATSVTLYFAPAEVSSSVILIDDVSCADRTINALKFWRVSGDGPIPASGTLAHSSGATHSDSIVFTASHAEPSSPFWNAQDGVNDVGGWSLRKAGVALDYVIIELGWNEWNNFYSGSTASDVTELLAQLRAEFPDLMIYLVGMANPSPLGGLGSDAGAYVDLSSYEYCRGFARAYNELLTSKAGTEVEYVAIAPVFDSANAYATVSTPVNTRSSDEEDRGSSGIHPGNSGYLQIADGVYRHFCATA